MTRPNVGYDRARVHHTLQINDSGTAVTSGLYSMDGLITAGANTTNPGFPFAVRLRGVFVHAGCLAINSAGNWTWRLRVNESGSDTATFTHTVPTVPGSKTIWIPTLSVILNPGDTYNVQTDGPSRNFLVLRTVLEWELL